MRDNLTLQDVYEYNIWHLINSYGLKYKWVNIEELSQILYSKDKTWESENQWIKKYQRHKIGLAKDIVQNGTFFPFFTSYNDDGDMILCGGRHRSESLTKLNHIYPIKRYFLVIYFPSKVNEILQIKKTNQPLFFSNEHNKLQKIIIKDFKTRDITNFLEILGSAYASQFPNVSKPLIFNSPLRFKRWINNPLDIGWLDITYSFRVELN